MRHGNLRAGARVLGMSEGGVTEFSVIDLGCMALGLAVCAMLIWFDGLAAFVRRKS
jgi:hypothetical protein